MAERQRVTLPRNALYALIVAYVATLAVGLLSILYANYVDSQSNQRWCGLVTTLDDTYSSQKPATPLGQSIAREINELRTEFRC